MAAIAWLVSAPAYGHPEVVPSEINRYVKVDLLSPTRYRFVYSRVVGAEPAFLERQLVDRNGDGRIDDHEKAGLGQRALAIAVAPAGFYVELDGKPVTLAYGPPEVGMSGTAVDASSFSVDLVATIEVAAAPHRVRVEDRSPTQTQSESELRIADSPSMNVVAAYRGEAGKGREMQFVFRGPKRTSLEDRSVTIETAPVATPAPEPLPRNKMWWLEVLVGAVGIAGALALALVLGRRRYRNMKG